MTTSISRWIGGGIIAGALALAGPGAVAQGTPAAALAPEAQDEARQNVWFTTSDEAPGWLGIRMEEIGSEKTKELKLPAERGALVTFVSEDSPAAKAGLKVNDVITEFDGQRVESTMALQRMVREVPAGRNVPVTVWREGRSQAISVQISSRHSVHISRGGNGDAFVIAPELPDMDIEVAPIPAIPAIPAMPAFNMGALRMFGAPVLGIDAEDLSGQFGNYFGAPDGQGVLVREVMPGTPAEKAGLKSGDVILRVDGKRVKNADDLRSALRDKTAKAGESADSEKAPAPAPTADLSVLRAGKEIAVRVELQAPSRRARPVHRVSV